MSQSGHFYQYNSFIGILYFFKYTANTKLAKTRNIKSDALKEYIARNNEYEKEAKLAPIKVQKNNKAKLYKKIAHHIDLNIGWRPFYIQRILNYLESDLFEDEIDFYNKWGSFLKQYLALKAKKWKLNDNDDQSKAKEEMMVCQICEKRFQVSKIVEHSKDCLEREKEKEHLASNHKKMLKLSEQAYDKKQELTVRSTIKKYF